MVFFCGFMLNFRVCICNYMFLGFMSHIILVGGLEHFSFFHILGIVIPTDLFFRGVENTNQLLLEYSMFLFLFLALPLLLSSSSAFVIVLNRIAILFYCYI